MRGIVSLSLLLCLPLGGFAMEPEDSRFTLLIDAGYRQDSGQWTISGGEAGPNIISDLEWSDLEVYELRLRGDLQVGRVIFDAKLAYGEMVSGTNRDSDYVYDDREGEFSRSTADTEGNTLDVEIGVGMPFTVSESGIVLTPLLGYAFNQQNHTDTNGVQEVDDAALAAELGEEAVGLGPFDGLESTYDAEWSGPYLGVGATFPVGQGGAILARYQFHIVEYYADLYWNLRDLAFENEADGIGHAFSIAYQRPLTEIMSLTLEASYTSFESDEGTQTDPGGDIDLNGAEWESLALRFGVSIDL